MPGWVAHTAAEASRSYTRLESAATKFVLPGQSGRLPFLKTVRKWATQFYEVPPVDTETVGTSS